MIRYLFICILIISVGIGKADAAKPKFFIQTYATGDEGGKLAEAYLGYFETLVFDGLKKTFPCVEINSSSTVSSLLSHERMRQLLGSGNDNALQNIAGAMGCEYLVCLKVNVSNNTALITAFCMDSKKAETLARTSETASHGSAGISAMEKVAKKLVEDLKEYEICPYYGPVTIEVKSDLDDTSTDYINGPCGGDMATITSTKKSNSTMKWELKKVARNACTGTAKYDLNEKLTIDSNYPCYKCKNGDQGSAKITETKESEAKTEGLSNESVSEGKQVDDARVKLVFLENGTYSVLVQATSKKGVLTETTEKKVEGICENESEPKDSKSKSIDLPIKVVFGPYQGTKEDKVLQQKETKDISQGKEKATLTLDFTLTRKDQ